MRLSIRISFFFFLLLALPFQGLAAQDDDFTIYRTQSRTGDELKRAAQGAGLAARMSVLNEKVVIYGSKSQRAAVLKLFGELDHRLQNYIVSVRSAAKGHSTREAHAIEGTVGNENGFGKNKSGVLNRKNGGSITASGAAGTIAVSTESSDEDDNGNVSESVVVMDGGDARIAQGSLFSNTVIVHLRSTGNHGAHIEIRQLTPSKAGQQSIITEIDLPLGRWRSLGGIRHQDTGRNGEILGSSKQGSQSVQDIQVRVELEPES